MHNRITYGLCILACLCSAGAWSQIDEHGPVAKPKKEAPTSEFKDRLVYGGNVGAFFGTSTFVNLNPMVGYKLTDEFVLGVGLNYVYYSNPVFKGSLLGKSVWGRYYFLEQFYAHTEFESIRYTQASYAELFKRDVNVALVGLGYQSNYFGVSILYDLIQDPYSPYSSPIIRVGGMIGIGN